VKKKSILVAAAFATLTALGGTVAWVAEGTASADTAPKVSLVEARATALRSVPGKIRKEELETRRAGRSTRSTSTRAPRSTRKSTSTPTPLSRTTAKMATGVHASIYVRGACGTAITNRAPPYVGLFHLILRG
jgi:hypothetical protein